MRWIEDLQTRGARVRLGELGAEQRELLYGAIEEMEADFTLQDERSLAFLAPLYLQALVRGKLGAAERIEALAMQIGNGPIRQEKPGNGKALGTRHHPDRIQTSAFADRVLEHTRGLAPRAEAIEEKVAAKLMLTPLESRTRLLLKNKAHQERVAERGPVIPEQIQHLIITCADARLGGLVGYSDLQAGTQVLYVAGNIADALRGEQMAHTLSRLAEGATISIVGHSGCGAVACACHAKQYAAHENIAGLIGQVDARGERENVIRQLKVLQGDESIQMLVAQRGVRLDGMLVDLHSKEVLPIRHDRAVDRQDRVLARRMEDNFCSKNAGADLEAHQYAHAILISSERHGGAIREIFDCEQANQVFCVSASDSHRPTRSGTLGKTGLGSAEMTMGGMLDRPALGSIEYSVAKNASPHIVLLHTDLSVLNAWKAELLEKSPMVRQAVESGRVVIDRFIYDEQSGQVHPLPL